jgi:transcriptional regulator with XRE-family HTH domain
MASTTPASAVPAPAARPEPEGTGAARDTLTGIAPAPEAPVYLMPASQGSPAPGSGRSTAGPEIAGRDRGPAMPRRRLGAELRRLREARSLRLEDAASQLGVAPSTLSRIETGKAPARTSYVRILLDLYGVTAEDERKSLVSLARQGRRKSWHAEHADLLPPGAGDYLDLEAAATSIRSYADRTVPGLLQTAPYAAAACQARRLGPGDGRSLAAVQQRRQETLARGRRELRVILDESALRRVIGTAEIMAGQLRHLAAAAAGPDQVTIQVIPLAAGHQVLSPPFTLLAFDGQDASTAAWISGIHGQVALTTRAMDTGYAASTFAALTRAALPPRESARLIQHLAEHAADPAADPFSPSRPAGSA